MANAKSNKNASVGASVVTTNRDKITTLTIGNRVIEAASAGGDTNWRDAVIVSGGITASLGRTSGKDFVTKAAKPVRATITFRDGDNNKLTTLEASAAKEIALMGKATTAYGEDGAPISAAQAKAIAQAGGVFFVDVLECASNLSMIERTAPATPEGFGTTTYN